MAPQTRPQPIKLESQHWIMRLNNWKRNLQKIGVFCVNRSLTSPRYTRSPSMACKKVFSFRWTVKSVFPISYLFFFLRLLIPTLTPLMDKSLTSTATKFCLFSLILSLLLLPNFHLLSPTCLLLHSRPAAWCLFVCLFARLLTLTFCMIILWFDNWK